MSSDRIVKSMLLQASRPRVWRALTDSQEFGSWFGMKIEGPFAAGATMRGVIAPTSADAQIAQMQTPYVGMAFEIRVEKIEPERLFSLRWHPFAIDPKADYSTEPMTLIEFVLEERADGILLTVTESGFEQIPLARRAMAFNANSGGWAMQMMLITKYLASNP
jgi:uncharacterized protein YndB with AHSA1/START domain